MHVTPSLNRDSVRRFGLDWRRMGAASGIAVCTGPEQQGGSVCRDEGEVELFVRLNDTGGER